MIDNELLTAISDMMDKKLAANSPRERLSDNELLLAISNMMDKKFEVNLAPINARLDKIEARLDRLEERVERLEARVTETEVCLKEHGTRLNHIELLLENNVVPRLNTIEACYVSVSNRYMRDADRFEVSIQDISVMKAVLVEHSEKLQKIS